MPIRKLCAGRGCQSLAIDGLSHCERHEAERLERLNASRVKAKTSAAALAGIELYRDPRWKRAAAAFLREHPLCADCAGLGLVVGAREVDHVKPHRGDRALFWDRSNWQALCKSCHSRKTAREVFAGRRRSGQ
ncbi:HNH endonuclease signature motif containing protein [uncultured Maritimibacter sp.]|uniref:HNH endonuclease n=1 Tax=uncultured Maritimibacter sp. TaxID=991866 RepID=UPI000A4663FA|nr:HNH endonuclease signature motif containing protein [uncultured Maritimibacter sp.]